MAKVNTIRSIGLDEFVRENLSNDKFRDAYTEERDALNLGMQIARLRKQAGLSQQQLAVRTRMRKQNIARLERPGYCAYTISTLRRIATALNARLDVRMTSLGEETKSAR